MISFFGGGEGLVSFGGGGAIAGGFGARFGLPWLMRVGRSHRSDVESEEAGVGVGGADDSDVILPPGIIWTSMNYLSKVFIFCIVLCVMWSCSYMDIERFI